LCTHDRRERELRAEDERRKLEAAKEQERQLEARLEQQRQEMERQLVEQREQFARLRAQMEEEARIKQQAAEERARCVPQPHPPGLRMSFGLAAARWTTDALLVPREQVLEQPLQHSSSVSWQVSRSSRGGMSYGSLVQSVTADEGGTVVV
jgi:glutamate synthase domain-containing protein 2